LQSDADPCIIAGQRVVASGVSLPKLRPVPQFARRPFFCALSWGMFLSVLMDRSRALFPSGSLSHSIPVFRSRVSGSLPTAVSVSWYGSLPSCVSIFAPGSLAYCVSFAPSDSLMTRVSIVSPGSLPRHVSIRRFGSLSSVVSFTLAGSLNGYVSIRAGG